MTPPVTTDALVADLAEAMLRHEWPNSPLVPFAEQDGPLRDYWLARAKTLVAGPLAPLLAAHQQVTAERDEEKARADWLAGIIIRVLRKLSTPVGTAASEDFWLGYLDGERLRQREIESTLMNELARLRAALEEIANGETEIFDEGLGCNISAWLTDDEMQDIARTALARAATAREGQADA